MTKFIDPQPWLNPITGDRLSTLPVDVNGHAVQGFLKRPRTYETYVLEALPTRGVRRDTPGMH